MNLSHRQLAALLPALAAAQQTPAQTQPPSRVYHHNQIPYTGDQRKKGRRFFYGRNRSDFNMEMHETPAR